MAEDWAVLELLGWLKLHLSLQSKIQYSSSVYVSSLFPFPLQLDPSNSNPILESWNMLNWKRPIRIRVQLLALRRTSQESHRVPEHIVPMNNRDHT